MSFRFMRIIVMFDLPVETLENKREYRRFRKFLIKKGFLMMQESIYCKLALNQTMAGLIANSVKENKPSEGLVQMMLITEKQYARMEYVVGECQSQVIDSDDRVVIL
ncbi:CRISPR-associated protein Cas2 [Aminicella lysinilytica]|uniref:CRISPR-associated endoribonuclease Cas2 n=2 Tax=Aminicella lysinilytica TaxID=433323 RepID=A0A4R6PZ52_9FIRM|nr:CRISPR-associated protein Cas2 [Aminicella lysinilytica]